MICAVCALRPAFCARPCPAGQWLGVGAPVPRRLSRLRAEQREGVLACSRAPTNGLRGLSRGVPGVCCRDKRDHFLIVAAVGRVSHSESSQPSKDMSSQSTQPSGRSRTFALRQLAAAAAKTRQARPFGPVRALQGTPFDAHASRRTAVPSVRGKKASSIYLVLSSAFLLPSSRARCRFGQAPAYGHHTISGASPRGF